MRSASAESGSHASALKRASAVLCFLPSMWTILGLYIMRCSQKQEVRSLDCGQNGIFWKPLLAWNLLKILQKNQWERRGSPAKNTGCTSLCTALLRSTQMHRAWLGFDIITISEHQLVGRWDDPLFLHVFQLCLVFGYQMMGDIPWCVVYTDWMSVTLCKNIVWGIDCSQVGEEPRKLIFEVGWRHLATALMHLTMPSLTRAHFLRSRLLRHRPSVLFCHTSPILPRGSRWGLG